MKYIRFVKIDSRYLKKEDTSPEMTTLGMFFATDYDPNWPSTKPWIKDPNTDGHEVESNITTWRKDFHGNIFIGYLIYEDEEEWTFKTTKEKFLKLLDDWDKLVKQNPKEITITVSEDGEIKVEGKN